MMALYIRWHFALAPLFGPRQGMHTCTHAHRDAQHMHNTRTHACMHASPHWEGSMLPGVCCLVKVASLCTGGMCADSAHVAHTCWCRRREDDAVMATNRGHRCIGRIASHNHTCVGLMTFVLGLNAFERRWVAPEGVMGGTLPVGMLQPVQLQLL